MNFRHIKNAGEDCKTEIIPPLEHYLFKDEEYEAKLLGYDFRAVYYVIFLIITDVWE